MKIFVLLALFGLGAETPDPALMLARAVSTTQLCPVDPPEKLRLDDNHKVVKAFPIDENDKSRGRSLTLSTLFKPARFELKEGGSSLLLGREVGIVNFFPVPKKKQLKAGKGEDAEYNKAMNHLMGSVYIDKETGGIVRIEARLAENVSYGLGLVKVYELSFSMEQELRNERWLPLYSQLEVAGSALAGMKVRHEQYNLRFRCTN